MNTPQLIVLAAGIGSRYGGLKQIEPLGPNRETILDYSIFDAIRAGFKRVIFVINKDIETEFRLKVEPTVGRCCEVAYVYQSLENIPTGFVIPKGRIKPWGTAHAVLSCKGLVDSPFAVINADDFYGRSAYESIYNFLCQSPQETKEAQYCMVGYILTNTLSEHGTVARGICSVGKNGLLLSVRELTGIKRFGSLVKHTEDGENWITIPGDSIVSMNMWGFTPRTLLELEKLFIPFLKASKDNLLDAEFYLPEAVNQLLRMNKASVKVLHTVDRWFGITYKPDKHVIKEAINGYIEEGIYPANLWEQVDGNQL